MRSLKNFGIMGRQDQLSTNGFFKPAKQNPGYSAYPRYSPSILVFSNIMSFCNVSSHEKYSFIFPEFSLGFYPELGCI